MDEASAAFASLVGLQSNGKAQEADERDSSLRENSEESWDEVEIPEDELMKEIVEEEDKDPGKKSEIFSRVESTESGDDLDETKPCVIEIEPHKPQDHLISGETCNNIDLVEKPASTETPPCPTINTAIIPSINTNTILTSPSAAPPSPVHSPPFHQRHHNSATTTSINSDTSPPARPYNITPLKLALPPTTSITTNTSNDDDNNNNNTNTNTSNFAQVIRERTQQRRAREDAAVSELRVQVHRLEAALAAESKRRVSAVQQIHQQSVRAVAELETRIQQTVREEQERVHERLTLLEERCRQLEMRWQEDVGAVQESVDHHGTQLKTQLAALQQTVATERQQRKSREQRLRNQMQEMADKYQELWKQERQERLRSFGTLEETMHSVYSSQNANVATFEGRIARALEDLERAVEREQQERHTSDEDIVDALNRYSKNLQDSLAAASGAAYY